MGVALQARQWMGRAGREAAGYCYRLYTQEHFEGAVHLPTTTSLGLVVDCSVPSCGGVVVQLG